MRTPEVKRHISSLTPAERQDLAARYPHESSVDLAVEFALSINQVANFAQANGLHKTPEGYCLNRRPRDSLTADVEHCVQAADPAGIGPDDLLTAVRLHAAGHRTGYITAHQIRVARVKCVTQLRIHAAQLGPGQRDQRWYGHASWLPPQHTAPTRPTSAALRAATELADRHERRRNKEADAATRLRAHIETPVSNPGQVPVHVYPGAPESRWAGLQVTEPCFTRLRPGEYLDDTPRPYIQAACRLAA